MARILAPGRLELPYVMNILKQPKLTFGGNNKFTTCLRFFVKRVCKEPGKKSYHSKHLLSYVFISRIRK